MEVTQLSSWGTWCRGWSLYRWQLLFVFSSSSVSFRFRRLKVPFAFYFTCHFNTTSHHSVWRCGVRLPVPTRRWHHNTGITQQHSSGAWRRRWCSHSEHSGGGWCRCSSVPGSETLYFLLIGCGCVIGSPIFSAQISVKQRFLILPLLHPLAKNWNFVGPSTTLWNSVGLELVELLHFLKYKTLDFCFSRIVLLHLFFICKVLGTASSKSIALSYQVRKWVSQFEIKLKYLLSKTTYNASVVGNVPAFIYCQWPPTSYL